MLVPTNADAAAASHDYLRSRWDDAVASRLDPVERLIYRSNLLGADALIAAVSGLVGPPSVNPSGRS